MSERRIIKSFGTILIDNKSVQKDFNKFKSSQAIFDFQIPKNFDGREKWKFYLTPIVSQGYCGNCWAIASTSSLADRWSILTKNYVKPYLSSVMVTLCDNVINNRPETDFKAISEQNLIAHTASSCFGNSIINALKFLYVYGAVDTNCVNYGFLLEKGVNIQLNKIQASQDLPNCQDVLGRDFDRCAGNQQVAARYYRAATFYQIPNDEEKIKKEIYKFGPIVSGFIVFDDFLSGYDGTTIYKGPKKDSQPTGGHAIRIVGWGEEKEGNETIKYWWIANSWGKDWGINGYFRMKIGIKECELETNMAAVLPDIPNLENPYLPDLQVTDNTTLLERADFEIDKETGYTDTAIQLIKTGKLFGYPDPIFPKNLNYNMKKFIAGEISLVPEIFLISGKPEVYNKIVIGVYIFIFIFTIITSFIIFKIFNKIKK
jgi:cathepsin B